MATDRLFTEVNRLVDRIVRGTKARAERAGFSDEDAALLEAYLRTSTRRKVLEQLREHVSRHLAETAGDGEPD